MSFQARRDLQASRWDTSKLRVEWKVTQVAQANLAPSAWNNSADVGSHMERTGIFISYSHTDKRWLDIVHPYFEPLEESHHAELWDDRRIQPGTRWRKEIAEVLGRAKIAILLVTQNFITSNFIKQQELPIILKAQRDRGLIIFWLAVKKCTPEPSIEEFQCANNPNKPVNSLSGSSRDRELVEVAKRLKAAIESGGAHPEEAPPLALTTPDEAKNTLVIASARIKQAIDSHSRTLDLSSLSLSELPNSVSQATDIHTLKLENNQLTHLPEALAHLSQLRELLLRNNRLENLPSRLGELKQLQRLDLGLNRLINVPQGISQLSQLQRLGLRGNGIRTLPASIGGLSRLKYLYLGDNRLSSLPDSFRRLAELEELSLRDNRLTRLPEHLGELGKLTMLDVAGNELTSLPNSVGHLARLEKLYLRDNQLAGLPDSLGKLERLRSIDLNGNNLTTLPKTLVTRIGSIELNASTNATAFGTNRP